MIPILIVIPFWPGDRSDAVELCKLIAHLQPHHAKNTAHVMIAERQDCKRETQMVDIISKKFNTLTHHCQSPLRGWPAGPNGMFASTMMQISFIQKNYECVFWMEPDCLPLRTNWFWDLAMEWKKRKPGVHVMGCMASVDGTAESQHITGCALYHPNIIRILPQIALSDNIAWDYFHRRAIVSVGQHTPLIVLHYKSSNASESLLNDQIAVVHGYKDGSLMRHLKKRHGMA